MDFFSGDLCPEMPTGWRCATLASLMSLLEKIPAVVWATDLEPRFTALTGAGLQASGVIARDFKDQPIDTLFPGTQSKVSALEAHRIALQGGVCSFDAALNGRDYVVHVQPLRGSEGLIIGVLGVALDDTERLVTQRAAQVSEENYRTLLDEAPYAICRATESGQMLQVNRAMSDMLGYVPGAEGDLLARDLPLVFDSTDAFYTFRTDLLKRGTIQGTDCTWITQGGQRVHVRIGGRAVRDGAGRLVYIDILAENVTERKELEARLGQAQKMQAIGQLAGGVAHDFNNLLTVILGQAEGLLEGPLSADQRSRLQDVQQAATRASALTRQLLAFSRRQILQPQLLNVNTLITQMSGLLGRLIRENIELTFVPGTDVGFIRADPNQIEQVVMNLTVNAQDALAQGGKISIETARVRIDSTNGQNSPSEPGDYVRIIVRDTGEGMDRETQAHVFEPFFTTKKVGEGSGLGLATSYGIVKQSGGQIQLESEPGKGTVFSVFLPRVADSHQPVAEPLTATAHPPPTGRETVLVAEDEAGVRELVTTQLRRLGYKVLAAASGEEALGIARAHTGTIDLLLSDVVMPKMGGRELALELQKIRPGLHVMFVSGYAGQTTEQALKGSGACILGKPFSLKELATTVRIALESGVQT
ncbi:MAG TPA: ATP-binding protein [Bryobacteraceae bacterium]|nr:ATP-binding protein [Bryobacteraceae bacterium]